MFDQFRHMKRYQIVDYTHEHCKEWQDPNGSSYPINPESVFRALGKDAEVSSSLAKHLREQRQLDSFLQKFR